MDLAHSTTTPTTNRIVRILVIVSVLFVLCHIAVRWIYRIKHWLPGKVEIMFDMSAETSLPTWFSVSLMLSLALSCVVLGWIRRHRGWYGPAALFMFLSADDSAMLHERFGQLIHPYLETGSVYVWVVVLGPVFAVLGLAILVFMWRAVADSPRHRRLLLMGFGCMGLALGLEGLEGVIESSGRTWRGILISRYVIPFEEWLEMMGPILLLKCVGSRIELEARAGDSQPCS